MRLGKVAGATRELALNEIDARRVADTPSTRVLVAAGFFSLAGIFAGVSVVVMTALSFMSLSRMPGATVPMFAIGLGLRVLTVAGLLWTARALRERERVGWYAGLLTLATPFVGVLAGTPLNIMQLALSGVGLALLLAARRDLR